MTRLTVILALFALLGGCAPATVLPENLPESEEKRGLAGHRFEIDSVVIEGQAVELIQVPQNPGAPVIAFGFDHIYGTGCNKFTSGQWEVYKGRLISDVWESEPRQCSAVLNRQDQWLLDFLISSPFLSRNGDDLILANDSTIISLREGAGINQPLRLF